MQSGISKLAKVVLSTLYTMHKQIVHLQILIVLLYYLTTLLPYYLCTLLPLYLCTSVSVLHHLNRCM
jgi:hypothetical protein